MYEYYGDIICLILQCPSKNKLHEFKNKSSTGGFGSFLML